MERKIKNFFDLEVWKKAHQFVIQIYKITKDFPREEQFGLTSQLRRAVISISANIAEGFERYHFKDKIRFYYQARGSIGEAHNFLLLAKGLRFIKKEDYAKLEKWLEELRKLLNGVIRSTEKTKRSTLITRYQLLVTSYYRYEKNFNR